MRLNSTFLIILSFLFGAYNSFSQWNSFAEIKFSDPNKYPYIVDMEIFQGDLYVMGFFEEVNGIPAYNISKFNGITWVDLPIVVESPIDLEVYNNELYILGFTGNFGTGITDHEYITKWNGTAWTVLIDSAFKDTPPDTPDPRKMEVYNGKLFIGGDHLIPFGSSTQKSLTIWNGSSFEQDSFQIIGTVMDLESNGNSLGFSGQFSIDGSIISVFGTLLNQMLTPHYPPTTSISSSAIMHLPSFTALTTAGSNIFKNGNWTYKDLKGKDDSHRVIKRNLVFGRFGNLFQIDTSTLSNELLFGDSLGFPSVKFSIFDGKVIVGPSNIHTQQIANLYYLDTLGLINGLKSEVNQKIKIFPNPNNGTFFIEGLNSNSKVNVVNLEGKIISTKQEWRDFHMKIEVKVSGPGIFFIKSNNPYAIQKIIVY